MSAGLNFEWVKACSECTPAKVFQRLLLELKQDVDTRNSLKAASDKYGFNLEIAGNSASVSVSGTRLIAAVTFELTNHGISVSKHVAAGKEKLCDATLTLNNDGDCLLMVNGKELNLWQFRKTTLETLFFNDPWD